MYYLYIILRQDCPYSQNLVKILKTNKIDFESITVSIQEKEKYKTDLIKTFPQVYLKSLSSNDSILIGGHDIVKDLIEYIDNDKYNINNNISVKANKINNKFNYYNNNLVDNIDNFMTF